jgi:hypothetical protein
MIGYEVDRYGNSNKPGGRVSGFDLQVGSQVERLDDFSAWR